MNKGNEISCKPQKICKMGKSINWRSLKLTQNLIKSTNLMNPKTHYHLIIQPINFTDKNLKYQNQSFWPSIKTHSFPQSKNLFFFQNLENQQKIKRLSQENFFLNLQFFFFPWSQKLDIKLLEGIVDLIRHQLRERSPQNLRKTSPVRKKPWP